MQLSLIFFNFFFNSFLKQTNGLSSAKEVDFYTEVLYPTFRRHRSRLRQRAFLFGGSPISKIRGARDVEKNINNVLNVQNECLYQMQTLFCNGMKTNNLNTSFSCGAEISLNENLDKKVNKFLISDVKINSTETNKFKLYLHPIPINENSSQTNNQNYQEKATILLDIKCWPKFVSFFKSQNNTLQILKVV
ncbi:unnamed protein product [Brachionus calyciflorus]|uniref:Uncharacterized protein n=1 Tax=Brachionus calyciflorus TaxID=104777 RepID=A0A814J9T1_9BILA|nr:unnamed protein product [Brachionus calyciflorus]